MERIITHDARIGRHRGAAIRSVALHTAEKLMAYVPVPSRLPNNTDWFQISNDWFLFSGRVALALGVGVSFSDGDRTFWSRRACVINGEMAFIGRRNLLTIIREAPPGFYLDGGGHGEILLPGRYIPGGVRPGGKMEVFVYRDSEDRLVATTETPLAMVGEFAYLRVVSVNPNVGVFLDWGLEKDLLLPLREQASPLRPGDRRVVRVALDERTDRIIASARLNRWLNLTPVPYTEGQRVNFIVTGDTPLGYNAIIENAHRGLLYRSELAGPIATGLRFDGYVRALREDGKIDLALDRAGFHRIAPLTEQILAALNESGGKLDLHDNSSPEDIRDKFGISKKAFKQAIGSLYRARKIVIEPSGIRIPNGPEPKK